MAIFEKITHLQKVWSVVLPHLAEPSVQDVARWCPYSVGTVETAILRAANRFSINRIHPDFDVVRAYKYVTATARAINGEVNAMRPCSSRTETMNSTLEKAKMNNSTSITAPDFESMASENPDLYRKQALRLLQAGKVTNATTFEDLAAILAEDAASEVAASPSAAQ